MKKPDWYAEEVAGLGQLVLDGVSTRAEALDILIARIRKHPEYITGLVAADAEKELSGWLKSNAAAEATPSSQLDLFPGLPHSMRIAPTKTAEIPEMTAEELDHAKNMLMARTQNAIDGATAAAEHERKVFMAFYERVRPLLTGDLTVADVLSQIEKAA